MRFVIVEDEIRIREGIQKLLPKLNKTNIVVGEAENGKEGLEVIRREKPDIIITDIRMPVMDGLEMLKILYDESYKGQVIVLSAYSEFEYAREAMHLGVMDYLLKPIIMEEFSDAVERVQQEQEKKNRQIQNYFASIDQVFRNVLNGSLHLDDKTVEYIKTDLNINPDRPISFLEVYYEKWDNTGVLKMIKSLTNILSGKEPLSFCAIQDEKSKNIILVIYNYKKELGLKRLFQNQFLIKDAQFIGTVIGWSEVENIFQLRNCYEKLESYLEWNISLGSEIIISYPEIQNVQVAVCVYPIEIENQIKAFMCANNLKEVERSIQKFHEYFHSNKVYAPKNIKNCYVRFFWAIINFSKEIGNLDFEKFEQQTMLERIMHSKTREELREITADLINKMQMPVGNVENISIKRALALIHEFYRMGITLEEIAYKLGITPEYLGTQFHKELGVNFSTYMKNYRMNKAKELLIGTQLKLYEIAELVGYSDAKYFGKVFKANTGMLPIEYRKMNK